jgi:hypothetical protein
VVCGARAYNKRGAILKTIRTMRRALTLALCALMLSFVAPSGATSSVLLMCGEQKPYLTAGTRENAIYLALRQSRHVECQQTADKIACLRMLGVSQGMNEQNFLCLLDCAGYISSRCPDIVLTTEPCVPTLPSACESMLTAFVKSIV